MPGILFQLSPCSPRGQSMAVLLVFACLLVFSSAIPVGEDDLRTELRAIAQRMTAQEAELKSSNAEVQALRTQVEDAQSEIVSLRSLVTARAATFEAKITARDGFTRFYTDKRIAQLEEIVKLHAKTTAFDARVVNFEAEIAPRDARIAKLEKMLPHIAGVHMTSRGQTALNRVEWGLKAESKMLDTCPSGCQDEINENLKPDIVHNYNEIVKLQIWLAGNVSSLNGQIAANKNSIAANKNSIAGNAASIKGNLQAISANTASLASIKTKVTYNHMNGAVASCPAGETVVSCSCGLGCGSWDIIGSACHCQCANTDWTAAVCLELVK